MIWAKPVTRVVSSILVLVAALAASVAGAQDPATKDPAAEDPAAEDPAPQWRSVVNPFDLERLESNDNTLHQAYTVAMAEGRVDDRKELVAAIGLPPQPIDQDALEGDWRCKTIKMGERLLPLVVYRWFDCRITREGELWRLSKLNGSQRQNGLIYPDAPDQMIFLGAMSLGDEAFMAAYSGPTGAMGDSPDNRDTPGVLTQRDKGLLTIGFPKPVVESDYDILVLKR